MKRPRSDTLETDPAVESNCGWSQANWLTADDQYLGAVFRIIALLYGIVRGE
jgi:hypothetical protein